MTKIRIIVSGIVGITLTIALCLSAHGAEEKWSSDVTGEAYLEGNMTADEAKNLCISRAKAKAVDEVAGTSVQREVLIVNYIKTADFIYAHADARIKEYKILKWDSESIQKTQDSSPLTMFRVHLKALVSVDNEGSSDFTVKITLNEDIFRDGDEMIISIKPTQDCYLTVFNLLTNEKEKLIVLVPSKYQESRFVKKGKTYIIPDKEIDRQVKLKMYNTSNMTAANEAILVVATLKDIDLLDGDFATADLNDQQKTSGILRNLYEKMKTIQPKELTMAIKPYEILRAKKK